jgi:hypothetical protein
MRGALLTFPKELLCRENGMSWEAKELCELKTELEEAWTSVDERPDDWGYKFVFSALGSIGGHSRRLLALIENEFWRKLAEQRGVALQTQLADADDRLRSQVTVTNQAASAEADVESLKDSHPRRDAEWLTHVSIATRCKCNSEAARKKLDRWRQKNSDGWKEFTDRSAREPKYLYDFCKVQYLFTDSSG